MIGWTPADVNAMSLTAFSEAVEGYARAHGAKDKSEDHGITPEMMDAWRHGG